MRNRAYRGERIEFDRAGQAAQVFGLIARHRRESVGLFMGLVAAGAIIVNALFLQPGRHPAPIWADKARPAAEAAVAATVALPRARPVESVAAPAAEPATTARSRTQIVADIQRELARRGFYDGAADGLWGAKTDAAMRDFAPAAGLNSPLEANEELLRAIAKSGVKATVGRGSSSELPARNDAIAEMVVPKTPAVPSNRILAVQRALADFGYGQIKPTGVFGLETQSAIERFERDRKLPVSGQISDRLTRELAAMTGRPLE